MQIWFIYRTSLWNAFAPLSRRVDPEILSHGAAPRLTNAPVYKGYLLSRSSNEEDHGTGRGGTGDKEFWEGTVEKSEKKKEERR